MPGMPHVIILPAAAVAGFIAWKLHRTAQKKIADAPVEMAPVENPAHIEWADVSDGAVLGLEIGYGLIGLVDERKDAPLMSRITGIRRQLSRELGFVVPMIRVRDNLALGPNQYRITIAGVTMGEDEIWPDDLLALDSGDLQSTVNGRVAKDPTFGLDAVWIEPTRRSEAVVAGYTVVDSSTVIATHLNHSHPAECSRDVRHGRGAQAARCVEGSRAAAGGRPDPAAAQPCTDRRGLPRAC